MANIKTTPEQWERAREYFESGLSLSQIVDKTGLCKSNISLRAKKESWPKGTYKEQLIADAVRVEVAKGTLKEQELSVHRELVDERTRHIQFFDALAIQNVTEAMAKPCEGQNDFKARAETISKSRTDVLGKQTDTVSNNNSVAVVTLHEALRLADRRKIVVDA
jgi:lambda repressor-like predicted transcriptional regulator